MCSNLPTSEPFLLRRGNDPAILIARSNKTYRPYRIYPLSGVAAHHPEQSLLSLPRSFNIDIHVSVRIALYLMRRSLIFFRKATSHV